MSDETVDITMDEREYSLNELSTLADVAPRTVRYYIVEGLLPPPLTTGRNATYSQEHLDRLNAIAALKEMYLPLREIRHRLNTLTPEQMRDPAYLASLSQAVAMDKAMGRRHGRRARHGAQMAAESLESEHRSAHQMHRRGPEHHESRRHRPHEDEVTMTQPSSQTWERFPLGDDAELIIRSNTAQKMGPRLFRALHKLRHMIEAETDSEGGNRS